MRGVAMLCDVYSDRARAHLSRRLADAFLAGPWVDAEAVARAELVLDRRPPWVRPLVGEVFAFYHRPPLDRPRELAAFVDLRLRQRDDAGAPPPRVRRWLVPEPAMGRRPWPSPPLPSLAALAEFLELGPGELLWLADVRSLERTVPDARLRNYGYGMLPRQGGPVRVIERPKARLKAAQRRVLHDLLDWIPSHQAAHGFTRGRSVISHAAAHSGRYAVVRLDLEDFFASVPTGRIHRMFRAAGYPEAVAHTLAGLVTNAVPAAVWHELPLPADRRLLAAHRRLGRRLAQPHLPQGAPTSPALANLAAHRLDRRLSGLAAALELTYTRYADDCVPRTQKEELSRSRIRWMWCCMRDEGARAIGRVALRDRRAGGGRKPPRGAPVKSRGAERRGEGALSARQVWITKASESEPPLKCRKRIGDIRNRGRVIAPGAAWREPVDWPGGCPAWMVARA
ncbi:MAG: reverse transcriptase family protein [Solirubrobacteraceae bacterium]